MKLFTFPRLVRYLAAIWLKTFANLCGLIASLIIIITFVEIVRRTTGLEDISFGVKLWQTLQQIPFILEKILPLLAILTTIWTIIRLNKFSELVILYNAGWSIWKIGVIWSSVAGCVGFFWVFFVNPLGIEGMRHYNQWKQSHFHKDTRILEQYYQEKQRIVFSATAHQTSPYKFSNVKLYFFNQNALIKQTIQADKASYNPLNNQLSLKVGQIIQHDSGHIMAQPFEKQVLLAPELKETVHLKTQTFTAYHLYEYFPLIYKNKLYNLENTMLYVQLYHLLMMPVLCMVLTGLAVTMMPKHERGVRLYVPLLAILLSGIVIFIADSVLQNSAINGLFPAFLSAILIKICAFVFSLWLLLSQEYKGLRKQNIFQQT